MKILKEIEKTREYLDYIENHINNVLKAWIEIQDKCNDMFFIQNDYLYESIGLAVIDHDLSKMSEFEFIQYRKTFFKCDYESKYDMTEALQHHLDNNSHHWENWSKKQYGNDQEWVIDCVHMVIDWMAMGYKFNDTAKAFYEKNKDKIKLPDKAIKFIYEIFERVY